MPATSHDESKPSSGAGERGCGGLRFLLHVMRSKGRFFAYSACLRALDVRMEPDISSWKSNHNGQCVSIWMAPGPFGGRTTHSGLAPEVHSIDRLTLKFQIVEELAFVPFEMLNHLKQMEAEGKCRARSPGSGDLFIGQIILAGLVDHLKGNDSVLC